MSAGDQKIFYFLSFAVCCIFSRLTPQNPKFFSMTSTTSEEDIKALLKEMSAASSLDSAPSESSFFKLNYHPSLVAVAVFGLLNSLNMFLINLKSWPPVLSGLIACLEGSLAFEWFHLHGMKLTRKEQIFFDEKNILETSKQLDYNLAPVIDDLTPGGIPAERQSVLAELFRSEKDAEMQRWYKMHYGNVYEHAMKTERQFKMMQEAERKQEGNVKK